MPQFTVSRLLILVAVILFVIAFLLAATIVGGGDENVTAWIAAGLAVFAASFLA